MGMIQIRNVPDEVHRTLKARAAKEGISLSDYLLRRVEAEARLPSLDEWFERLEKLPKVETRVSAADLVREGREERTAHLDRVIDEAKERDEKATRRKTG